MIVLDKFIQIALVALALGWCPTASAQNIDALNVTLPHCRDWLDILDHKKPPDGTRGDGLNQGRCIGIVEGLYAADAGRCPPPDLNLAKVVRLVVTYIESLPEPRQNNFKALALEAMHTAWPCEAK